jgi:hypothetical protein
MESTSHTNSERKSRSILRESKIRGLEKTVKQHTQCVGYKIIKNGYWQREM